MFEGGSDDGKGSRLFEQFAAERREILRHKWMESEKAGRDIGFDRALLSWLVHHRSAWMKQRDNPSEHPGDRPED